VASIIEMGGVASKPRDLGSDRGYRVANQALLYFGTWRI
jgi:hypothetical protein